MVSRGGFFGVSTFLLVVGIIFTVAAVLWKIGSNRSNPNLGWTGGMIVLLVIGIILIVLGFIFVFFAIFFVRAPDVVPVAGPIPVIRPTIRIPVRTRDPAEVAADSAQVEVNRKERNQLRKQSFFDPIIKDIVPYYTLENRCKTMNFDKLAAAVKMYPESYGLVCDAVLGTRSIYGGVYPR